MNVRALAISRNPDLLQRPTGKLHWQGGVAAEAKKHVSHEGDEAALQTYIEANKQILEAEAAAR